MSVRPFARRMCVYSPQDVYLLDIDVNDIEGTISETINGTHQMELNTETVLGKECRILFRDGTNKWREYVIVGIDQQHQNGRARRGTYRAIWSLQHDLKLYTISKFPGIDNPVNATTALTAVLSGTDRWAVGTVTVNSTGGTSMYERSGWEALSNLLETWGGEIDARITVGMYGVVSRHVDYLTALGSSTVTRRFDYTRDLKGITRTVDDEPVAVRIIPRGKGEETDYDGFGRKIKISSVNGGVEWLQNNNTAPLYRLPDGSGGYEYPTIYVDNGDMEDPLDLKDWALSVLEEYTTPKVTYKSSVYQYAAAGMDPRGVTLGDIVQCVDHEFYADGLRILGRVTTIKASLSDNRNKELTIGHTQTGIAGTLGGIRSSINALQKTVNKNAANTAAILADTLSYLNEQINATGGYTYLTEGQGIRTYDRAVTNPAVGDEATAVVEIKGGTIRIANSRTGAGDWDWKTVFTSGHILASLVTAAQLTAGYIGSATGNGNYWNLDTGQFNLVGSLHMLTSCNILNNTDVYRNRTLEISADVVTETDRDVVTQLTYVYGLEQSSQYNLPVLRLSTKYSDGSEAGYFYLLPPIFGNRASFYTDTTMGFFCGKESVKGSAGVFVFNNGASLSGNTRNTSYGRVEIFYDSSISGNKLRLWAKDISISCGNGGTVTIAGPVTMGETFFGGNVTMDRNLTVDGTKSREVATDNYADRLLYCYETPAPMFGDVGSATIGSDGTCVVSIDDIFQETARTDMAYQVFLQKCGQGDLWVSEKTPTHFVVEGTVNLAFDWQLFAHQIGYETTRLENAQIAADESTMGDADLSPLQLYENYDRDDGTEAYNYIYAEELRYTEQLESAYEGA